MIESRAQKEPGRLEEGFHSKPVTTWVVGPQGKEGFTVNKASAKSITPGQYRYRPTQYMPWMNVKVFKQSAQQDKLSVRFAGVELDADMFLRHGQWKAL